MTDWIHALFADPELTRMGHGQRAADANLGLGWVYYGLARTLRPATAVVIGSYRGFVPLVLAKALSDNAESGRVVFIDPSLVDDFWTDPARVSAHFTRHGVNNVDHFRMTTQEFTATAEYHDLTDVGLVFVDGWHTLDQVRFDHAAFRDKLTADAIVLFHDSAHIRTTRIYGPERAYEHRVVDYIGELKLDPAYQVFDLPHAAGVTLVRRADDRPQ